MIELNDKEVVIQNLNRAIPIDDIEKIELLTPSIRSAGSKVILDAVTNLLSSAIVQNDEKADVILKIGLKSKEILEIRLNRAPLSKYSNDFKRYVKSARTLIDRFYFYKK